MKQLKDFKPEQTQTQDSEVLDQAMGKYKDMNEEQLIAELMNAVKAAKADGSFDEEALQNFFDLVSPVLGDDQREKLHNLISVIKMQD